MKLSFTINHLKKQKLVVNFATTLEADPIVQLFIYPRTQNIDIRLIGTIISMLNANANLI